MGRTINSRYNDVLPSSCGPVLKELRAIPECMKAPTAASPLPISVATDLVRERDSLVSITHLVY